MLICYCLHIFLTVYKYIVFTHVIRGPVGLYLYETPARTVEVICKDNRSWQFTTYFKYYHFISLAERNEITPTVKSDFNTNKARFVRHLIKRMRFFTTQKFLLGVIHFGQVYLFRELDRCDFLTVSWEITHEKRTI